MNYDLERSDLATVLAEARLVAEAASRTFGQLSAAQINWKPSEADWSIGQCFDHLIISNRGYLPILQAILAGRKKPALWERVPVLPGIFGPMLVRALRPDSGRKLRARKAFRPSASGVEADIIGRFLAQQDQLLRLMEATKNLDRDTIIVTSPVMGLITYSLMDAYRIITVHEQNHFVQARRVLESDGFPKTQGGSGAIPGCRREPPQRGENLGITRAAKRSRVRNASSSLMPPKLICIEGSISPKASIWTWSCSTTSSGVPIRA